MRKLSLLAILALSAFNGSGAILPALGPTAFPNDDAFLDYVQRQTFNFFWDEVSPTNGLIRDRSQVSSPCSIASIGFGLSAINIAVERGWVTRDMARARVLTTLQTLWNLPQNASVSAVAGYHGWYYHFLSSGTGYRAWNCELSTIDTALLMLGVIDSGLFFDDPADPSEAAIRDLSDRLINRVDWTFVLRPNDNAVTMQWTPENGYSSSGWSGYNEATCMYLLGLGAATNSLPQASWDAWTSGYQWSTNYGYSYATCPPLFTHQYSQAWIDFRGIADGYMRAKGSDYFENSRRATLAQRQYAIQTAGRFANYGSNEWGLTACDGPNKTVSGFVYQGYAARGAPAGPDDGTIAPTAALGSMPFAPEVCLPAAHHFYDAYMTNIWTTEGFRDAYNIRAGWWDADVIGIDEGPIVLMLENYRTGSVWRRMMRSPMIQRGLQRAGFTAPPPDVVAASVRSATQIDVTWSGLSTYQTGFQVQTSTNGTSFTLASTVASNVYNITLPAVPNTTYYIRVLTTSAAGLSGFRQTVSVTTPAPGPRINAIQLSGTNVVMSGSDGLSNVPYYVLSSSNVTLPMAEWSWVATNYFDGAGQFSVTSPMVLNTTRGFYRLQVP